MDEGNRPRLAEKPANVGRPAPGNRNRQLGQSLVDPRVLRRVGVPVDGVLELMGQNVEIRLAVHGNSIDVDVDRFVLVAPRSYGTRVLVAGAEITSNARQPGVHDEQVRVVVYARSPFRSEGPGDIGVNVVFEYGRRLFQRLVVDLPALLRIPVGVSGD